MICSELQCALSSLQCVLSRAHWCESHGSRLHTFFMHPRLSSFHIELRKDKMVYFGISPNTCPHILLYIDQYVSVYLDLYQEMVAPLSSDIIPYWQNGFQMIYTCPMHPISEFTNITFRMSMICVCYLIWGILSSGIWYWVSDIYQVCEVLYLVTESLAPSVSGTTYLSDTQWLM